MSMLPFFCLVSLGIVSAALAKGSKSAQQLIVILLGPPGSGKGTQAVRLSQELALPHISTGDLFRENIKNGTPLGLKAKQYIDQGQLGPDNLVMDMLFDRISQDDCKNGYVLDGFPRRLTQAESLEKRLGSNVKLMILNLHVPDDALIERLTGRMICRSCGHNYHLEFAPPKKAGVCDICGGEVYQRSDDKKDVVEERLKIYHMQSQPLEEFYDKRGLLQHVDGQRPPDEVAKDLLERVVSKKR